MTVGVGTGWAFECPARIDEARAAVQKVEAALDKAKAAAKAAARGPLGKAKEMLAHAEAEHKGAGNDAKKYAEAVREARLIAEPLAVGDGVVARGRRDDGHPHRSSAWYPPRRGRLQRGHRTPSRLRARGRPWMWAETRR